MYVNANFNSPLKLGELRELVNSGKLSKFPDDIQINMCINIGEQNAIDEGGEDTAPVMSIVGDENKINFYNYI